MNTFKIDFAYTEFSGRIEGYKAVSADANEAKTRLWIVDDILLNVLDWNKTDIEPEK